jgi:predicted nucleic acid-binding protein
VRIFEIYCAEAKYSIVKKDGAAAWAKAAKAAKVLEGLPIDFHSTTRALADSSADFKARFKLSLADAFAAALAREKKAELVTGDPEFKPLDQEIKIHWLR